MNCNNCGTQLNENSQFCPNCGTKNEMSNLQKNAEINNQSVVYNGSNNQVNNFNNVPYTNNTNTIYNNFNQTPVKVKKKPYWLLGVLPFSLGFLFKMIQIVIGLIAETGEETILEPNATMLFLDKIFGILSLVSWLAVIPCIIIMIVLYSKRTPNEVQNEQIQINKILNSNVNFDDKLLAVYIGKNYQKIINNKFSIPAFFLNWIYMLYRKMYIPAIIGMIGITILNLIPVISTFAAFAIMIVLGIFFNKWYIDYSRKQIQKIKANNQNSTEMELVDICKKQGGTNVIIGIIIYVIFLFINSL